MQKHLKVGLEVEFFLLNSSGEPINRSDFIIKSLRNTHIGDYVREEISQSMLEVGAPAKKEVVSLFTGFVHILDKILSFAEKSKIHLLPLGTYPGKFHPTLRKKLWYDAQKTLVGEKNMIHTGRICGFHFHYSLPPGIVDKKFQIISLNNFLHSGNIFLNQYNFMVASDPAFITLLQSSPFYEGRHLAKDSRTLIYRDMVLAKEPVVRGLYFSNPMFGGLPNYNFTIEDLRNESAKRKNRYLDLLLSNNIKVGELASYTDLRFMWGPIRVNRIGTLEYRGLDMNLPSYLFEISLLITFLMDEIKNKKLLAIPSDIGLKEPFKLEDRVIYLPPFSIVKSVEYLSTIYGLENSEVFKYTKSLLSLAFKLGLSKDSIPFLNRVISEKKTVSDQILEISKKNSQELTNLSKDFVEYLALYYSKRFASDLNKLKERLDSQ